MSHSPFTAVALGLIWPFFMGSVIGSGGGVGPPGPEGKEGPAGKEGKEGPAGKEGKEGPAGKVENIVWKELEAISAKLEQVTPCRGGELSGIAYLVGQFKPKEAIPAKSIIFTLPAALRPEHERHLNVLNNLAGTVSHSITIKVSGEVEVQTEVKATEVIILDGSSYGLKV